MNVKLDSSHAALLQDPSRIAALRATGLLDSPPEEAFDRLANLARRMLDAPVCLVSLVEIDRQFFKSCVGLPEPWASIRQTPLSHSFCQHVVATGAPLVVEDARKHPLLRENLAIRDLNVIAYLGIPLVTPDAQAIGSFCAIDTRSRAWTPDEIALMRDLADSVMSEIALRHTTINALRQSEAELRRRNAELVAAVEDARAARHQAEQAATALGKSKARLEKVLEVETVGVMFWDVSTGRLTDANDTFLNVMGYSRGELEAGALSWQKFTPLEHHEASLSELKKFEASGRVGPFEKEYLRKDGARRWFVFAGSSLGGDCCVEFCVDISDRKHAEAALRLSEERFRNAVADAAIGFAMGTPDGAYIDANPVYCAITGYSVDELRRMTFHDILHPQDVAANMEAARRMLSGEAASCVFESRYRRKDGRDVWVRKSLSTTSDDDGQIKWVVALIEDISERKDAEAGLQRLNATLEERVRAEVGEREAAQARLAQAEKLSALGQLAGGVAHDFNNIAQAVTGGASMIARHADNPAKVRRFAGMLVESAARAASITRRLLSLARRGDLRAEAIAIAPLLQGLAEFLGHTLGSNVALRVEAPADLPPVSVDKAQLETALVNLATNARDAIAGAGAITFKAKLERLPRGREKVGLAPGTYVRVCVADDGSGMDAVTIKRAVEPFFTTKAPGRGTGLGLPMARGFAEQSGGALDIRSAVGRGATVSIWLPVAEEAQASRIDESAAPRMPNGPKRILLVDDDDAIREILKGELTDAGFAVIDATGAAMALTALASGEQVDLLISDLSMPGLDGLALIRAAQERRKQEKRGRLPAILLTGYAGDAATLALGDAASGAICLLRKPVTGCELAERAAMMLELPP